MAAINLHLQTFWRNGRPYVAIFLLSLLFFPITAQAEAWEEVWPDQYYFNSDTAFVDLETGFVFFEVAAWDSAEGDYHYSFMAVDCTRWESFAVAAFLNGSYLYMEGWQTDPRLAAGPLGDTSYMAMTSRRVCGIRDSFPRDYPGNRF
jgi:hypothetical protein